MAKGGIKKKRQRVVLTLTEVDEHSYKVDYTFEPSIKSLGPPPYSRVLTMGLRLSLLCRNPEFWASLAVPIEAKSLIVKAENAIITPDAIH